MRINAGIWAHQTLWVCAVRKWLYASSCEDGRIPAMQGPGYPLVSFLPAAKKDTASIPCANQNRFAVLNLDPPGGVWGKAPNSENQNAERFGSPCASMPPEIYPQ
jgi:hypothetical protein